LMGQSPAAADQGAGRVAVRVACQDAGRVQPRRPARVRRHLYAPRGRAQRAASAGHARARAAREDHHPVPHGAHLQARRPCELCSSSCSHSRPPAPGGADLQARRPCHLCVLARFHECRPVLVSCSSCLMELMFQARRSCRACVLACLRMACCAAARSLRSSAPSTVAAHSGVCRCRAWRRCCLRYRLACGKALMRLRRAPSRASRRREPLRCWPTGGARARSRAACRQSSAPSR